MVMVRSIITSRISKRWSNPHNILDRKESNTSRQNTTLAGEQVVFIMWTSSRWKEVKGVVDDNKNHRGPGWYFSSWIQSISWKSSKCWWWSRHNCREISRRCNRSAMTSSQRTDEAKGYWNHEYDTNSKSSLLFKTKWYDEENRRKLSSSSKVVLRE